MTQKVIFCLISSFIVLFQVSSYVIHPVTQVCGLSQFMGRNLLKNEWKFQPLRVSSNIIEKIEKRRSLISSASSSMFGFLLGDIFAQIFASPAPINWLRVLRMGSFGFWVHAPMSRLFYKSLEKDLPDRSASTLMKKIFSEQLIYAPTLSAMLIFSLGALKGESPRLIYSSLRRNFFYIATSQWILWPIVHLMNFYLIPSTYKQRFLNVAQLLSNMIISKLAH